MALFDTTWYLSSVGHAAVSTWAVATAKTVGNFIRATAPTAANERIFICIVAGTTHATTQPTWVVTRGAKTTDNTVTWQECTGQTSLNGDVTNTTLSSAVRSQTALTLGQMIKNNSATHYFILSTAGNTGAGEPSYNTTTGATTTDNTAVWTCVGPVGNFTGGQAPFSRFQNVATATWFVNGNTIFVADNHAESTAAAISVASGQLSSPLKLICHPAAGSWPPTTGSTGATITTTGANSITLSMAGSYVEGVTFSAGTGATNASITFGGGLVYYQKYKNCSFQAPGTTAGGFKLTGPNAPGKIDWENCTIKFGNVGDGIRPRLNSWRWHSTGQILAAGSSVPTSLFQTGTTGGTLGDIHLENLDLSQCTGSIINSQGNLAQDLMGSHVIKDCKLHASTAPVAVGLSISQTPAFNCDVINCSSGDINYNNSRYSRVGVQTTEITIVRTGGATDGTTPVSAKIVTIAQNQANNNWAWAFECIPIAVWNETTGSSMTATVEGIWGGGAVPNNDDIWIEAVYPSDASSPLSTRVSGSKAYFSSANAPLASSSETWGGSTTAFKMTVTFTPQQKGFIYVYVMVGRASATFYVDPKVTLS